GTAGRGEAGRPQPGPPPAPRAHAPADSRNIRPPPPPPPLPVAAPRQPAAAESRAAESAHDVLVLTHQTPQHLRPVVLDHQQNRTLIDPQLLVVEPADTGHH